MKYSEWEPFYHRVLQRFDFSETEDTRSAERFSAAVEAIRQKSAGEKEPFDTVSMIKKKIAGKTAVVCGNAPSLKREYAFYAEQKKAGNEIYIAADGAATVLIQNGRVPDIIVTDLDGRYPNDVVKEIEAADKGALLFVHAHGDNFEELEKYLPALEEKLKEHAVVPTCQGCPPKHLFNFGGFTDGDRCVFLADEFGAQQIILLGFDFKDPAVLPLKTKKLECAEQLIRVLHQKQPEKIRYFNDI